MDGVPSPLQIASPPTARRPSEPQVPEALRAGSPAIGATASPHARPPLIRKNTSGASDRLSQLFQSRPSSAASITPPDSTSRSRQTSFPSALVPASDPAYRIPRAPAPPSFQEDTSYDPTPNSYSQPDAPPTVQSRSGTKQLLSRLTSLSRGNSKGGRYQKLDDEESGRRRGGRLRGVEEEDEAIGYDLSGFDGLPMKGFEPKTKSLNTADVDDRDHDIREASHIAEFERLEAQLGAGMTSILQKPFTHTPTEPVQRSTTRHKRHKSVEAVANEQAKDAQIEAEKTGDIVAVPFDISESIAGADFDRRSSMATASTALAKDEVQTSYYFPPDPDMPSWRPFTMGWPWIAGLVIVAVCLAGVQEYLCQISMKNVREDPKNGGLAHFEKAGDLTVAMYFAWQYAPIMIFVFYGILWQMTDFEVKRLEPFYQLSKKTGATAGESLNMDYLTFMSWLVPLRALRHKQFAVIYSSLGTLIASSLLPVLQSASLEMYPPKSQRDTQAMKSIRVDPRWSRAVSASLLLVAFCGGALMYAMRRKSGLQSNPKGIAGIAAMATKSHILADFRGLDTAPLNKIHKQLRHRRYILHKSSLWQGEYIRNSRDKIRETGTDPRPLMLRKRLGIPFVGFLLAFTGGIPVLMFLPKASIVTEKLPWLTTGLATIIRIMWNTMNCDVRMLQPFFILAKRHAPAKTLTLDYAGTNPLWLPFQAAFNGHWLVMLVAIGSVLTELLTVCVSSISVDGKRFMPGAGGQDWDDDHDGNNNDANDRYNTEQTFRSFWSSLALTMLILIYLIAIAILTYMRRSHKFMPRQIGTMASVLAFIHQSKMLVNFVDTEMYDSGKMTKHLEASGKKYALGWFAGRDGEDHLGIDEEEVLSEYKYGVDWTNSRITGMQVGMWERY